MSNENQEELFSILEQFSWNIKKEHAIMLLDFLIESGLKTALQYVVFPDRAMQSLNSRAKRRK